MFSLTEAQLLGWMLALLQPLFRLLGLFSTAPVLSSRSIPVRVRVAFAVIVAVVCAPVVAPAAQAPAPVIGPAMYLLLMAEMLTGLAIGMVVRLIVSTLDVAGELIGLQMGLSFAGFFDPSAGQGNAVGRLISTLGLAVFVALDGPAALIAATVGSLQTLPVRAPAGGGASGTLTALQWFSALPFGALLARVFELALMLSLPYAALLLFINLALGLMSRVAPQLNIFSIGFPVTLLAGLLMLAATLPGLGQPFRELFARALRLVGAA